MPKSNAVALLLEQLEESYRKQSWHGTNLRGSVRGLTMDQLCWRPAPQRHNIWELTVHCAYWKYIVRRRITNEQHGSFPIKGSNFFPRPQDRSAAAWKRDLLLLDDMHDQLVSAVLELSDADLSKFPRGSKFTHRQTITGIAMHDIYHAGQIQLLKRLQR